METETLQQKAEQLTSHLADYADTFLKVTLVNATEKGSTMASAAITTLILAGLALFALFFGGFALAWWLGNLLDSLAAGFVIVTGFYLLLFVVGMMLRKKTIFPYLRNRIIRSIYE